MDGWMDGRRRRTSRGCDGEGMRMVRKRRKEGKDSGRERSEKME